LAATGRSRIGRRRLYIRPKIEAQLLDDADAQRLQ
jgi:hypothetical protein